MLIWIRSWKFARVRDTGIRWWVFRGKSILLPILSSRKLLIMRELCLRVPFLRSLVRKAMVSLGEYIKLLRKMLIINLVYMVPRVVNLLELLLMGTIMLGSVECW